MRLPVWDEQILSFGQSMTRREIAAKVGCCMDTVTKCWRRNGIGHAKDNCTPITRERLEIAKRCLDDGWSWSEIYKTHGISQQTMRKYFPGTQWTKEQIAQMSSMVQRARHSSKLIEKGETE